MCPRSYALIGMSLLAPCSPPHPEIREKRVKVYLNHPTGCVLAGVSIAVAGSERKFSLQDLAAIAIEQKEERMLFSPASYLSQRRQKEIRSNDSSYARCRVSKNQALVSIQERDVFRHTREGMCHSLSLQRLCQLPVHATRHARMYGKERKR